MNKKIGAFLLIVFFAISPVAQAASSDNYYSLLALLRSLLAGQLAQSVPTTGLVAHWNFDEGSGSVAQDTSGNGNNANLSGATWTTGKVGSSAVALNGSNQTLVTGSLGTFAQSLGTGATIAFWIKSADASSYKSIMGAINSASPEANKLRLALNSNYGGGTSAGGLMAEIIANGASPAAIQAGADNAVPLNTWTHVAVMINGSASTVDFYVNGVKQATTYGIRQAPTSFVPFTSNFGLGTVGTYVDRPLNGALDDVYVYSRALSASEISTLYQLGSGQTTTPPPSPTTVSVSVSNSGTGTGTVSGSGISCGSTCSTSVTSGTSVTLSATANSGSVFSGWSGACSGASSTCTFTASANSSVTASWTANVTTTPPPTTTTSDLIPDDRRINWTGKVGVENGIQNRTQICANVKNAPYNAKGDGVADDTAAIAAAIKDCPTSQVVYIPAGTYNVNSTLQLVWKSITIRGDGPKSTILRGPGSPMIQIGNFSFGRISNITGGMTKGSSVITLSDMTNVTPGQILLLDELNDGNLVRNTTSNYFGFCGWCSRAQGTRTLAQLSKVVAVNGNNVTIDPPLHFTYSSSLSPQAVVMDAMTWFAGVENLKLQSTGGPLDMINFTGTVDSWVKNVETERTGGNSITANYSYRCEIRDSYIHEQTSFQPGVDGSIIAGTASTGCLIENNQATRIHSAYLLNWGATGNVFGYNYSYENIGDGDNILSPDIAVHGAHPKMNLFEGNVIGLVNPDSGWGSSSHNTFFRNAITGWTVRPSIGNPLIDGNIRAVSIDGFSRYYNFLGNILGSPVYINHTPAASIFMVKTPETNAWNTPYIWRIGYQGSGDPGTKPNQDTETFATMIMHGNRDVLTNSTIWSPNITNTSLPSSMYLSSKPSWFGNLTWPPIGPDVAGYSGDIPAKYCFAKGMMPNCLDGSSSTTPPPSPTTYPVSIAKLGTAPTLGTVSGGGISCGTICTVNVNSGASVTISATAATGAVFAGWSGACTGTSATCTFTVTGNTAVTATFNTAVVTPTTYSLSVVKSGTGLGTVTGTGISCGTDCSETVNPGTTITLSATPSAGSAFSGWGGACTGTGSCTVALTNNALVSAQFDTIADTLPPDRSNGTPSGVLQFTTSVAMSIATNEAASCRYSLTANSLFGNMTPFSSTGGTYHSTQLTNLSATSYAYYVKCQDAAGNVNPTDFPIIFSIAAQIPVPVDSTAPTVEITRPLNGEAWTDGRLAIAASASDNSVVSGVTFFVDNIQLGSEDTVASYGVNWRATVGTHTLTARARDNSGNTAVSQPVTVTIVPGTKGNKSTLVTSTAGTKTSTTLAPAGTLASSQLAQATLIEDSVIGVAPSTQVEVAAPTDPASMLVSVKDAPAIPTIVKTPATVAPTYSSYRFTRTLSLGSKGEDVRALQQFLNTHGFPVATTGAGSRGRESTTFGPGTKNALTRYQRANRISPASGSFGPLTKSKVSSVWR